MTKKKEDYKESERVDKERGDGGFFSL